MNFKNKAEYTAKRESLMNQISNLVNENETEKANDLMNQVEQIDNDWHEQAIELANTQALAEKFKNLSNLGGKEDMEKEKIENISIVENEKFRNAFLKNLQGKTLTAEESQLINTAANSSAAIPTQTMNKIVAIIETAPILNAIDLTYIPSNVTYPVESAMADASWVAMATASTDSTATLTSITLNSYKLIKTVEITADVQAMSIDAFEDWLTTRLGEKLMKALAASVFTGTGTAQPTGILTTIPSPTGTFTKTGMTYADLCTILAALGAQFANNGMFAMQRKLFYSDVIGMVDASKKPVVVQDPQSPAKYNILGYPVILDDNMKEDTVLYGDFKSYKMNIANNPSVEKDYSVGFRAGSTVYRAMVLSDGKCSLENAFVRYDRASS